MLLKSGDAPQEFTYWHISKVTPHCVSSEDSVQSRAGPFANFGRRLAIAQFLWPSFAHQVNAAKRLSQHQGRREAQRQA
jgi:hypothetical protein